jgi:hypothetical protein
VRPGDVSEAAATALTLRRQARFDDQLLAPLTSNPGIFRDFDDTL